MKRSYLLFLLCISVNAYTAGSAFPWRDNQTERLKALAFMQTLQVDLLSHTSATDTLERWCGSHGLADPAVIVAELDPNPKMIVPPDVRSRFSHPTELIRHRHVKLLCGELVLSEADNWYQPHLLTLDMNRELAEGSTPFGKVVQPLHYYRITLSSNSLWEPFPLGLDSKLRTPNKSPQSQLELPFYLFEHRALLMTPSGKVFSVLIERYTKNILNFSH